MSGTPKVIKVSRAELLAQRTDILARYGLPSDARYAHDCGCCPAMTMDWDDFSRLGDIDFLLGE